MRDYLEECFLTLLSLSGFAAVLALLILLTVATIRATIWIIYL